ncbi:hypothetical protein Q4543_20795 [Salipiger sp. 1_MG-2023]|uniref:hypothetical protein n=1 Tax=Salipiger sp. 1_MG-2023 TaxID=3062665 RepID=UPI0026E36F83|nr:hypothetical protein [Salipiger sp. 1_MG-2023]MDO6587954.1 hypothetical protein [Salipiger sp. 1_MG-2023]
MGDSLYDIMDLPEGLETPPYGFDWTGPVDHRAPSRMTPFKEALLGKTHNALTLLAAGSMIWAARRLSRAGDVTKLIQIAEVNLCWQASPLYFNRDSPYFFEEDEDEYGLIEEIVETIAMNGTTDFQRSPGRHNPFPPLQDTANIVALSQHVMGARFESAFKDWARGLVTRLAVIAPNPEQQRVDPPRPKDDGYSAYKARLIGPPLPPEAANLSLPFDPGMRAALYSAFLQRVDWAANPYLNPPDKMKALGFEGEPYT